MPTRRSADPSTIQHIWDAIQSTALKKEVVDHNAIEKYLQNINYCTPLQTDLYIQQAREDGFIVTLSKNIENDELIETLGVTTQELPILDGKDWYCFECHLAGDVTICCKCFRVYHADCISTSRRRYEEFKKATVPLNNIIVKQQQKDQILDNSLNISSNSDENNILKENSSYRTLLNNNINNVDEKNLTISEKITYDATLCTICNISQINNSHSSLDKTELNYLLRFVMLRIQSWLPNVITHKMGEEERPEWLTDKELSWRATQLFFQHRDMSIIEMKLTNECYLYVYEFLADVLTIHHNVAIFHGLESQEYGAADLMVRDMIHDLSEMNICVDCYRHSNEKVNAKWFCVPCRVPHKLVWAKQKGYPHWPAKIIRETNTHFDVRFFGGKYERSMLPKTSVKPIDTPKEKLQIKVTTVFNKAVDELKYHQKLLNNPMEVTKLIQSPKPKNRTTSKSRTSLPKTPNNTKPLNLPPMTPLLPPAPTKRSNSFREPKTDVFRFDETLPSPQSSTPIKRKNSFGGEENPVNKRRSTIENNSQSMEPAISSDNNVINISSEGEDDHAEFSYRNNCSVENLDYNGGTIYDQVSSSTENYKNLDSLKEVQNNGMQILDHPFSDSVERMRRELECLSDKNDIIKRAMESMQTEIDRITNNHNEYLKKIFETHNTQISETKKKQWCYNCEQDAIYHCCWNTAYCSQSCQQQHWQAEHKKVCRRKR